MDWRVRGESLPPSMTGPRDSTEIVPCLVSLFPIFAFSLLAAFSSLCRVRSTVSSSSLVLILSAKPRQKVQSLISHPRLKPWHDLHGPEYCAHFLTSPSWCGQPILWFLRIIWPHLQGEKTSRESVSPKPNRLEHGCGFPKENLGVMIQTWGNVCYSCENNQCLFQQRLSIKEGGEGRAIERPHRFALKRTCSGTWLLLGLWTTMGSCQLYPLGCSWPVSMVGAVPLGTPCPWAIAVQEVSICWARLPQRRTLWDVSCPKPHSLLSQVSDLCRDLKAACTSSCYPSFSRHFPKYSCTPVIILVYSELQSHTHLSQLCLSNGWMLCVQFDFGQWSKRGTAFWASDAAWWGRRNRLKANSSSEKLILNSVCIQPHSHFNFSST